MSRVLGQASRPSAATLKPVSRDELGSALAVIPAATADDCPASEDDADELDGGHAWVVVFCVWLVLFVFLGQVYSFAVLYATFLDVFAR